MSGSISSFDDSERYDSLCRVCAFGNGEEINTDGTLATPHHKWNAYFDGAIYRSEYPLCPGQDQLVEAGYVGVLADWFARGFNQI